MLAFLAACHNGYLKKHRIDFAAKKLPGLG